MFDGFDLETLEPLMAFIWPFVFCVLSQEPFGLHPLRMAYPTVYSRSEIYGIGTKILLLQ